MDFNHVFILGRAGYRKDLLSVNSLYMHRFSPYIEEITCLNNNYQLVVL